MDYMKLNIQLFADNGTITIAAKINTKDFDNGLKRMQNTSEKAGNSIKNIVAGLGITKLISKGLSVISSSIDDAVSRVDTLRNFPKVMSNLGISAEDSSKAIKKMSDKLSGLPTTLDQGAMAVQRFTSKNGDVSKSTDIFLALNNAILAGGASTEIQSNALEQLAQSYSKGKMDMMEWRAIQTAMPAQLKQVADAMGLDVDALGEMMRQGDNTAETMDEFIETIIKLNKEGSKGFQSFEKQARNSTAGIGTSITVAKTQVVKGLENIIKGLDKELKKSGTSISKIFAEMGNKTKQALDKIGTALSKINFGKLLNTLKSLVPVIKAVAAAWATWKIGSALSSLSTKISLAKESLALFSQKMAAAGTSQGLLNTAIGKSSVLMKSFGSEVTSSTKATSILSSSLASTSSIMALLPWAGAVAGAGLLAYGIYKITQSTDEYIKSANNQIKANKKIIESQQEANKEMEKRANKSGYEMQYYKNLQAELSTIVDENGKIEEGYEDRAKIITGILKDALGVEANITNGIVQNYKQYNNEIDKAIAKKKAKVILDAQEEQYSEAIKNQLKYQQQMGEAYKEIEKWQKKIAEAKEQQSTLDPIRDKEEHERLSNDINKYQEYLDTKQEQYDTAKQVVDEYTNDIIVYETNLKNFQEGNYDAMIQDMNGYITKLSGNNEEKKKQLDKDIQTEETTLNNLRELKKKNHSDVYDDQIAAHEKTLEQYKKEREDLKKKIAEDRTTWLAGTAQTLTQLSGQKIKFEDVGNGFVQAYVDGSKAGQPVAYKNLDDFANNIQGKLGENTNISSEEAKKLIKKYSKKLSDSDSKDKAKQSAKKIGEAQIKGIESKRSGFVKAGENSAQGAVDGATSQASLNKLYNSGKKMAQTQEQGYKDHAQIHSPSRLFSKISSFIPKGAALGINKNSKIAVDSVKNMVDDMYKEMDRAVDMETGKIATSVQTSGTYQLAMTGTPTFNLRDNSTNQTQLVVNGRVLAEVVNTENRNREVARS